MTLNTYATDTDEYEAELVPVGTGQQKVFKGKYHFVSEEGDTLLMLVMNNITILPPLKFKNKKQEQFYWRTVRDVKRTLPYAKLICETLIETYEYIETFPTQKEREKHLKEMEEQFLNNTSLCLKNSLNHKQKCL